MARQSDQTIRQIGGLVGLREDSVVFSGIFTPLTPTMVQLAIIIPHTGNDHSVARQTEVLWVR